MELTITAGESARLIAPVGEVDVSNAGEMRAALEAALAEGAPAIEVDLGAVSYIDSTGIGVLVGAALRAEEAHVAFAVHNPQPNVRRVLGLLGVERELKIIE